MRYNAFFIGLENLSLAISGAKFLSERSGNYFEFIKGFHLFVESVSLSGEPLNLELLARIYWETRIWDFYHTNETGDKFYIGMNVGHNKLLSDSVIIKSLLIANERIPVIFAYQVWRKNLWLKEIEKKIEFYKTFYTKVGRTL